MDHGVKMNIDIYSKTEVRKIIDEQMHKEMKFAYAEIDKLRNKLNNIEELLNAMIRFKKETEGLGPLNITTDSSGRRKKKN